MKETNEKNVVKISLSTFFLILALVVIIIMGIFIYKISIEKTLREDEISNLNDQIKNLEDSINSYKSKLDSIANTVNSNNSNEIQKTDNVTVEGTYVWENPDGTGVTYTFSNGKFKMQSSWMYEGSYEISGNKIVLKTEYTYDYSTMNKIKAEGQDAIEIEGTINGDTITLNEKEMTRVIVKK